MIKKHIVFIDDGINSNGSSFSLLHDLEISSDFLNFTKRSSTDRSDTSHGTLCAAIVKKYSPNFLCSSLKILDDIEKKCNISSLCTALKWCAACGVDIINISLGSTYFRDAEKILPLINMLSYKGITVVCAAANNYKATYPASFCNAICVVDSFQYGEGKTLFFDSSAGGIDIATISRHILPLGDGMLLDTGIANSYAAPYVVARICNIYKNIPIPSNEEVKLQLFQSSDNYTKQKNIFYIRFDWADSVSLVSTADNFLPEKIPFAISSFRQRSVALPLLCLDGLEYDKSDTVVFFWDEVLSKKEKQASINIAATSGKHIVLIDDFPEFAIDFSKCTGKVWSSSKWRPHFEEDAALNENLIVPLLIVYDSQRKRLLESCFLLADNFCKAGYNALVTSNDPLGILYNFFYTPYQQDNDIKYLNYIQNFYQADLILCSVYGNNNTLGPHIENFVALNADIHIGFVDIGRNSNGKVLYVNMQKWSDIRDDELNITINEQGDRDNSIFCLLLSILENNKNEML